MSISTEYNAYLLLVCLAIGFAAGWFLYRNNPLHLESKYAKSINYLLLGLRSSTLFILLFLLLGPLLKWMNSHTEKPIIAIAIDNSSSIIYGKDSTETRKILTEKLKTLTDDLSKDYEIKTYAFGQSNRLSDAFDFKDKRSNLSSILEEINSTYEGQNLGGIILATDGIYNAGANPLSVAEQLPIPVFTISLGDTNQYKDLLFKKVRYNKTVFSGNSFTLQMDIAAHACKNAQTQLTITHDGQLIKSESIAIDNSSFFKTINFNIDAPADGSQHYILQLKPIQGEVTKANNRYDVFVQVIKNKQKILILAQSPHPDMAAYSASLSANENYEVQTTLIDQAGINVNQDVSLVIAYQIPGTNGEGLPILKQIQSKRIPILYVLGAQFGFPYLPALTNNSFSISANRYSTSEVTAVPEPLFTYFTLTETELSHIQKFPPLWAPYGNYKITGESSVFLKQQIGNVETNYPLVFFQQNNSIKQGFICGEGFWKWRLYDFNISNQQTTQNILSKMIQYLVEKKDLSPFQVMSSKRFDESEDIVLNAELYNESNELVNTPNPIIEIKNSNGKVFSFAFNKTEKAYSLNAGNFAPGNYTYNASVLLGAKTLTTKGAFVVIPAQLELIETVANHQLLQEISTSTKGKMYFASNMEKIQKDLQNDTNITSVVYKEEELKSLISLKWIFILVIGLLSLEWFIRKWNGSI